ncbi:hypothetical protein KKD61_03510 [Patescibacteria group bacterium]|nr:hypothetical protein [Patescibacteria group bacterium]
MKILKRKIQDVKNNFTFFALIGKGYSTPGVRSADTPGVCCH